MNGPLKPIDLLKGSNALPGLPQANGPMEPAIVAPVGDTTAPPQSETTDRSGDSRWHDVLEALKALTEAIATRLAPEQTNQAAEPKVVEHAQTPGLDDQEVGLTYKLTDPEPAESPPEPPADPSIDGDVQALSDPVAPQSVTRDAPMDTAATAERPELADLSEAQVQSDSPSVASTDATPAAAAADPDLTDTDGTDKVVEAIDRLRESLLDAMRGSGEPAAQPATMADEPLRGVSPGLDALQAVSSDSYGSEPAVDLARSAPAEPPTVLAESSEQPANEWAGKLDEAMDVLVAIRDKLDEVVEAVKSIDSNPTVGG